MEITGKIIFAGETKSGVSQKTGKNWSTKDYVVETMEQYPRKCCFSVFGEDKIKEWNISVGEMLTISFDIDAREYNGRWYNSISAWKIARGANESSANTNTSVASTPVAANAEPAKSAPSQVAQTKADDDLPF